MLASKHSTRSPETGHYFIENQKYVMLVAPMAQLSQHPRGPSPHSCRTLNQRLNDNRGKSAGFCPIQLFQIVSPDHRKLISRESVMEVCDIPETRCSQSISVISVSKRGKPSLFRKTGLLEVLDRHLNGHLDPGRAIIGIEHAGETAIRKQVYQLLGQSP